MKIIKENIYLKNLNRQAFIYVMLPKNYDDDLKYPLLFMHDGQNVFFDSDASFGTSWGLKDIYEQSDLKDRFVVGLSCASGLDRLDEYNPFLSNVKIGMDGNSRMTGGKGDIYIHTIIDEVFPLLKSRYNIDFSNVIIGGSSMGGHISLYATLMYPKIFKHAICISNAFWISEKDLIAFIEKNRKKHQGYIYLDTGDNEDEKDFTYIKSNELVFESLKKKGVNVTYDLIQGGTHNEASWRKRIKEILSLFDAL